MKLSRLLTLIALAGAATLMTTTSVYAKKEDHRSGKPDRAVIYVASQDMFYDTLLLGTLPYNETDNFQQLFMDGPMAPYTEFGPRDTGYYGGRWWVDANSDGIMDEGDIYFLCPLLGNGRAEP